jgi:hypothetical protein
MANRLTRVPDSPVPELPGPVRLILPLADLFMLAMISRPATGSLRTTWVTPATLYMCLAMVVGGVPAGALLLLSGAGSAARTTLAFGTIVLLFTAGACAVAIVGLSQRAVARGS